MNTTLSDRDWVNLLKKIERGACVPFLGAGACYGALPLGGDIAREWAEQFHYPMSDTGDLVRVSQFLAVEYDLTYPKELVLERLAKCSPPNFREPDEPHGVLADLPLKYYLTTNYDDFMVRALEGRLRNVQREYCRWNDLLRKEPTLFDREPTYEPSLSRPLVYHLHGHTDPNSVVLTEDDYLTFLAAMQDPKMIPDCVEKAISSSSLLFIGYRMADWNIRVVLQGLRRLGQGIGGRGNLSIMVLVPPDGPEGTQQKLQEYLDRYYAAIDLRVYWGTARQFCGELASRWKQRPQS
jgi:hypothetical protein